MDAGSTDWDVLKAITTGFMAVLGWLGIHQIGRINKLEASRVGKEEHQRELARVAEESQKAVERVESSLAEHRVEIRTELSRIVQRLDVLADRLPNK